MAQRIPDFEQNAVTDLAYRAAALIGVAASVGAFAHSAEARYQPNMERYPQALGERSLALVMVNFEGKRPLPFSRETVQEQTFDAPGSVADYYHRASFGQFSLRGEVIGPVTVASGVVSKNCRTTNTLEIEGNVDRVGPVANRAVMRQTGRDLAEFNTYAYTLPRSGNAVNCDFGGMSFGNASVNLETRAKFGLPPHQYYAGVVTHELSHNYGLEHANSIRCSVKGNPVAYSMELYMNERCKETEYGDPIDPMGQGHITTGTPPDMSALNKARLGWLAPENIRTMKQNGEATIAPLEVKTDKPQLIRVPTGMTVNNKPRYFYMDFRQPIELDSTIPADSPLVNGVAIREAGSISISRGSDFSLGNSTNFIDTTPKTRQTTDGTLMAGKTFKDPSTGVSVKTVSIGPEGATIRVSGLHKRKTP